MSSGPRPVRAPRGPVLSCRTWQAEAALRMLMNNLDPEVAEDPDRPRRLRRPRPGGAVLGCVRRHRRRAAGARPRRDPAGAIGQAGGRAANAPGRAARAHRQQQPGAALGDVRATFDDLAPPRAHHVRADDGRLLDLHWHARNPAGDVRDLRRVRAPAFRRQPPRPVGRHRRLRRHGWGPASGGHHERRRLPDRRRRRRQAPSPTRQADAGRNRRRARRCHRSGASRGGRRAGGIGGGGGERRRPAETGCWRAGWCPTCSPIRPRRTTFSRYVPVGLTARRRRRRCATSDPAAYGERSLDSMARHVRAMLALMRAGAITFDYGNNLRAAGPVARGRRCLRVSRLRSRLHPPAVLPGAGTVSLGGALRRPGRHLHHR